MLVLSRRIGEEIILYENIRIVVVDIRGDKIRLGVDAPKDVPIHRKEVKEKINKEKSLSQKS